MPRDRFGDYYEPEPVKKIVEHPLPKGVSLNLPPQAQRIVEEIMPGVMDRFIAKNRGYQLASENLAEMLGAKGQWGDLFRKIMVTKASLWNLVDDGPLLNEDEWEPGAPRPESVEERLEDIVGHALLAIDMLRQGNRG